MSEHHVHDLAEALGGEIRSMEKLPDGSACATAAHSLPLDHWLTLPPSESRPGVLYDPPPMPFRCGTEGELNFTLRTGGARIKRGRLRREGLKELICGAARNAIRSSTMNGTEMDFDPDAMVQNFVVAMLGYNSPDGLSSDGWANPVEEVSHG